METIEYLLIGWIAGAAILFTLLSVPSLYRAFQDEKDDPMPDCLNHTVGGNYFDHGDIMIELDVMTRGRDERIAVIGEGNADGDYEAYCPFCEELITTVSGEGWPIMPEEGDWFNGRRV
jgi:hypothetical protein